MKWLFCYLPLVFLIHKTVPPQLQFYVTRKSSNLPQSPNWQKATTTPTQHMRTYIELQIRRTQIEQGKKGVHSNSCASQHLTQTLALAVNYIICNNRMVFHNLSAAFLAMQLTIAGHALLEQFQSPKKKKGREHRNFHKSMRLTMVRTG